MRSATTPGHARPHDANPLFASVSLAPGEQQGRRSEGVRGKGKGKVEGEGEGADGQRESGSRTCTAGWLSNPVQRGGGKGVEWGYRGSPREIFARIMMGIRVYLKGWRRGHAGKGCGGTAGLGWVPAMVEDQAGGLRHVDGESEKRQCCH